MTKELAEHICPECGNSYITYWARICPECKIKRAKNYHRTYNTEHYRPSENAVRIDLEATKAKIKASFDKGHNQRDIAKEMNLTPERIRQLVTETGLYEYYQNLKKSGFFKKHHCPSCGVPITTNQSKRGGCMTCIPSERVHGCKCIVCGDDAVYHGIACYRCFNRIRGRIYNDSEVKFETTEEEKIFNRLTSGKN